MRPGFGWEPLDSTYGRQALRLEYSDTASLILIIPVRRPMIHGIVEQPVHVVLHSTIWQIWTEARSKLADHPIGSASKARQVWSTHRHHLRQEGNPVTSAAQGHESPHEEIAEGLEVYAVWPTQQLHVLVGELEGRCFKTDVAAGRVPKHEPKINMNEVALVVQKDIAVVPILDLQHVAGNGVASKAPHKISPSVFERRASLRSEVEAEEVHERRIRRKVAPKAVQADGIADRLDDPAACARCNNVVRPEPDGNLCLLPDLPDGMQQLRCELLLPEIVVRLDDDREQPPALDAPEP
mmetsp:Transcript_8100/g.30425  ORF Transcript_8100/g.30425 Transcript_8100/m.30425 type:complete len:296 (-) Transcript_8100:718-1605(-)